MIKRNASFLVLAGVIALASGCSSSNNNNNNNGGGPVERIVFSDQARLHLATFDGTHLVTVSTAEIPPAGLLAKHAIYGIIKHPTKPWLYAVSMNDTWGNARIDRFDVSQSSIAWVAREFNFDESVSTLDPCMADTTGTPAGVNNWCAPVDGTFSADGNHLFVQNDDFNNMDFFAVDPDGALSLVKVSVNDSTYLHGVAIDPSGVGTYIYNGSNVLGVAGDLVTTGDGGNYTKYLKTNAGPRLLTVQDNSTSSLAQLAMYDLTVAADPVLIATAFTGANQARSVVMNDAMNRVVVGGQNSIKTYGWSGSAFSAEGSFDPHVGTTNVEGRSVALLSGGGHAAMSFFVKDAGSPSGFSGGVSVYGIDPSGAITTVGTVKLPGEARVVQSLKL